jgi:glycosyltransferase involved in cell wall biosynthesis
MRPYVLITAARNEEAYIEKTIRSVVAQTILPAKWVIVSDGSTDRTDEIVSHYTESYDFILILRRSADQERNYGSKVRALKLAYEQVTNLEYEFVGNLDADVSFGPMYYERALLKFDSNERLGIAGGIRYDLWNGQFRKLNPARTSAGGPTQLFRRQCYEEIGGYLPLRFGGEDTVVETMARMHGWEVETFPDLEVSHYRYTGTSDGGPIRAKFKAGILAYSLGYHPLFEAARCAFRLFDHPAVVGSFALLVGYCWAALKGYERQVPDDYVQHLRAEQFARLRSVVFRKGMVGAARRVSDPSQTPDVKPVEDLQ